MIQDVTVQAETKTTTEQPVRPDRSEMIVAHREVGKKLAGKMLRAWRIRLTADELESVVDVTLCEAALRFDTSFGTQFSTFLFHHIRGNLLQTIRQGVGAKRIMDAARQTASCLSGNSKAPVTAEGEDKPLQLEPELLGMREIENPEQAFLRKERGSFLESALQKLNAEEQIVIGGLYFRSQSIQSLAQEMRLSRKQIVAIRCSGLQRLRASASDLGFLPKPPEPPAGRQVASSRRPRRRLQRIHTAEATPSVFRHHALIPTNAAPHFTKIDLPRSLRATRNYRQKRTPLVANGLSK